MVMQDKNFDPLKKAFENNSWYWEESKELFANITVKNKGDMWLYNYNEDVLVPRNHPVLVRCRGIVVSTTGQVLNYPLDRFFNDYEKECADIDWDSALVQEKVDGSMVCVFWNGGGWEITTRGSFYPIPNADLDFADLFKKHFSSFDELWE